MTTQDLTIKLKLKDDASKGMGTASRNIKGHAGKIKDNLGKIGTVGGGALTVAAGAALKLGDMFKDAENIIAAGTGATGENLEDLKDSFSDVFKEVPDDAATVASAIADINTEFGFTGDKLEAVAELALAAGRAMDEDMGKLIKSTADTLIQFGEPAENVESLLDKLTVASQASGVSMADLTDLTKKFAPALQAMGLGLDESLALVTNLESAGFKTAKMMPGLSGAMKKLADEGVTDIAAGLQDAIDEIKNADSETEALGKAMDLFGATAGPKFKEAIDQGVFSLDDIMGAMADSDGALALLAESTLTSADKFDIMKNKVMDAAAPIGEFAVAAGPMLMVLPALITLTSALSGAKVISTVATYAQATAMMFLNVAMGPIGLIILGIVAAIVLAVVIFKNFGKIVKVFKAIWELVTTKIKALFDSKFGWLLPGGVFVKGILRIKDNWKKIWDKVKSTFKTVVDAIKGLVDTAFGWLFPGGSFASALETLGNYWATIWGFMKDSFDGVVGGLKGGVNIILKAFNALIRGANAIQISIPSWVPVIGGKKFGLNIPEIPLLAKGGIVTKPTLAMVGENGPEAVIPLRRGGAGMGVTVNINFPARGTVVLGDDMAARKLAQALTPLIRQALRGQPGFA